MFKDVVIGLWESISGFFIAYWPILKYIIIPAGLFAVYFLITGIINWFKYH